MRASPRPGLAFAILALIGLAATSCRPVGQSPAHAHRPRAGAAPNIVLVLTDDQRFDTLWAMPNVQSELVAHGVTFSNAFVANSMCCPSRSSILTGDYSHTTKVYGNVGRYGGFHAFHDTSTIATWLHDAGYRTGLFGKYLNGYTTTYIPPGWDEWDAFLSAGENGDYYNYSLNQDGTTVRYGNTSDDYSTTVLAGMADSFVRTTAPGQPLFAYVALKAPHSPAAPEARYAKTFGDLEPYRPPSYNEADVSDKPGWVQAQPLLTDQRQANQDRFRRRQYRSLLSVDDAVNTIVTALSDTGRLANTLFVFASDNGIAWGEHRWIDKMAPYEEVIRIPLVIRYDALGLAPGTDDHLVANIDFAPTMAEAAGVIAPPTDGVSLLPLLTDPQAPWRHDLLVEHRQQRTQGDRGRASTDPIPTYCEVRDDSLQPQGFAYVRYLTTGEEELYDLATDPFELQNQATNPAYASQLAALRSIEAGLCVPPPP